MIALIYASMAVLLPAIRETTNFLRPDKTLVTNMVFLIVQTVVYFPVSIIIFHRFIKLATKFRYVYGMIN